MARSVVAATLVALAPLAPAHAQTPAAGGTASGTGEPRAGAGSLDRAELRAAADRLMARLDDAFRRGDRQEYLRAFRPENRVLWTALQQRLDYALKMAPRFTRSTEVLKVQRIADRVVIGVRARFQGTDERTGQPSVDAHALLACVPERRDGQLELVPGFSVLVDYPQLVDHVLDGRYRCGVCNWSLGGDQRWLTVPTRPANRTCVESVTFYRLGADLTVDVQVLLAEREWTAARFLRLSVQPLLDRVAEAGVAIPELQVRGWLPPALEQPDQPTAAGRRRVTGAQALVQVPGNRPASFHVLAADRLIYAITVEGSPGAMQELEGDWRGLLDGFRFLEPDRDPADTAASTAEMFGGGELRDGNRFAHERLRLVLDGPPEWAGRSRVGAQLFDVAWRCPEDQGRLWIHGHRPPAGLERWNRQLAEQHLILLLARNGLEVVELPPWQEPVGPRGFASRTLELAGNPERPGWSGAPRLICLAVRDDVLIVMEGLYRTDRAAAALRRSMGSLATD